MTEPTIGDIVKRREEWRDEVVEIAELLGLGISTFLTPGPFVRVNLYDLMDTLGHQREINGQLELAI